MAYTASRLENVALQATCECGVLRQCYTELKRELAAAYTALGPEANQAIELHDHIFRLKSDLAEAKAGWDSCITDLREAAQICQGVQDQLAEERKAAGWKDELLKEFDTAAGTILEDAGCLHDDGLVCEICQPFVDARKKYADHINPSSQEPKL